MSKVIPFNSLAAATEVDRAAIETALRRVLDSGWFILGGETAGFEEEFARYLGGGQVIGVASGTDAIEVALRGLGIGDGDSVATVSLTAVGTVVGIQRSGAEPVFVDVDPKTYTMDPASLQRTLAHHRGKRIRCILPVHLYGQPAAMDDLIEIAEDAGAFILEDCAQATGAGYRGALAGSRGHAAAFSFYPTKNLAAIGDGGAVYTRDTSVAERCREIRQYGWKQRYISASDGVNSRLDELQSAVLRARLPLLQERNRRRRTIAEAYTAAIADSCLEAPHVASTTSEHAYHQYVVRSGLRDTLKNHLEGDEIQTGVLYPVPIHLQAAYQERYPMDPAGLRETEMICREILCLPIFPELTVDQVEKVVNSLRRFSRENE